MDDAKTQSVPAGGRWTIPVLLLGLCVTAACVIVPQMDANRRLAYERDRLVADLDQINRQSSVNEEFLAKIEEDPQLAQRLAQRQMSFIPKGESLLPYKPPHSGLPIAASDISPFSLVHLPAPPMQAPYEPAGPEPAQLLLDSHVRLYALAGGLYLVAMGLVLGSNGRDVRVSA